MPNPSFCHVIVPSCGNGMHITCYGRESDQYAEDILYLLQVHTVHPVSYSTCISPISPLYIVCCVIMHTLVPSHTWDFQWSWLCETILTFSSFKMFFLKTWIRKHFFIGKGKFFYSNCASTVCWLLLYEIQLKSSLIIKNIKLDSTSYSAPAWLRGSLTRLSAFMFPASCGWRLWNICSLHPPFHNLHKWLSQC